MLKFLLIPFPRPKSDRKNALWIFIFGVIASLFVVIFNPFNIVNNEVAWYYYFFIFSIGLVLSASIVFMELIIPVIFKKPFKHWHIGKAIAWYTWLIIFVGGVIFLYKSFLAGFTDFTWLEYLKVIGRLSGIALIVSFFAIGVVSYFRKSNIARLSSNEDFLITAPGTSSIRLQLDSVLYVASDDNYVDIHLNEGGKRRKIVFRSSLKNIEAQIVNPITPMYRCHRGYIVNINHFTVKDSRSRNTSLVLKAYNDEIPVSGKYAATVLALLQEEV